jgi:hypothetical protein
MTSNDAIIRHDFDTLADFDFAEVAINHPEAVSTSDTYPGWTPACGCTPYGSCRCLTF